MFNNENHKNSLIMSKKSQSLENELNKNEKLVRQPEQFDNSLTNDINHSKNERPRIGFLT